MFTHQPIVGFRNIGCLIFTLGWFWYYQRPIVLCCRCLVKLRWKICIIYCFTFTFPPLHCLGIINAICIFLASIWLKFWLRVISSLELWVSFFDSVHQVFISRLEFFHIWYIKQIILFGCKFWSVLFSWNKLLISLGLHAHFKSAIFCSLKQLLTLFELLIN